MKLKITIALPFLIYIAACTYMSVNQRSFLYFPQPVASHVADEWSIEQVSFDHQGTHLAGYKVNAGQAKALLYYGGNAEAIGHQIDFFRKFSNYTVYMIPYRGFAGNLGETTEANLFKDALFIYDQISGEHQSTSAVGRSLGSGVASFVASQREIDKLVLITPYDSVVEVAKESYWMLPVDLLMQDKFDSYSRANAIMADTLVIIAENDQVIKRARSERLLTALNPEITSTEILLGIGHSKIFNQPMLAAEMSDFLNKP